MALNEAKYTQESIGFTDTADSLQYEDYTVGWICALLLGLAAAAAMLDEAHEPPESIPQDINTYKFGRIGRHNVVLACLPLDSYGTNSAAMVAAHMSRSFPTITTRLMVGVGGGAPGQGVDIRLGDVVVGSQVIQYDLGKATAGGHFDRIGDPVKPPPALLTAVSNLASTHSIMPLRLSASVSDMLARRPNLSKFGRPRSQDVLFKYTYDHPSRADTCDACDPNQQVHRQPRSSDDPIIHYGKIASGNRVIKDGTENQRLARELNVLCFEMEAAGLSDHFPCLIIRGICDYADSHKNNVWQEYAAATAAAYAKEVLLAIPAERIYKVKSPPPPPKESAMPENKKSLLRALHFSELSSRQISIKPALSRTCEWFLEDDAYLDWLCPSKLHEHHGFLWMSGEPGAGKSTMMKFVYERTEKRTIESSTTTVLSFFFNARGAALEKSTEGMYRSLLHQLFELFPQVMQSLQESGYSAYMRDGPRS
jgi:nucleoside phosphorylase